MLFGLCQNKNQTTANFKTFHKHLQAGFWSFLFHQILSISQREQYM